MLLLAVTVTMLGAAPCLAQGKLAKGERQKIAEEAFIYGFPMIMNYGIMYEFFIDKSSSQYKTTVNQIFNEANVATPKDTAVVTPNSDTPYSFLEMDLWAEPIVLTVPEVEKGRYYSIQLVDMYTFNYGYIGSRATGNGAGSYMIAGPTWKGTRPKGIKKVFLSETDYSLALFRTQLFNPADIDNVKKIQAAYQAETLSQFLARSTPAPPPGGAVRWPKFDKAMAEADPFGYLAFLLQFCPTVGGAKVEVSLRDRFTSIGIEPGKPFQIDRFTPEQKAEIKKGALSGLEKIKQRAATIGKNENGWLVTTAAFGDRKAYKGDWTLRAAAAMAGILGNSPAEAFYPILVHGQRGQQARHQQERLHADLPGGTDAAGQRLLVGDHVRRQDAAPGREPDQPVPDQLADAAGPEEERGRLAHLVPAEGLAGRGQGVELAARAGWPHLRRDAALLAQGRSAQGKVEAARRHARQVSEGAALISRLGPRIVTGLCRSPPSRRRSPRWTRSTGISARTTTSGCARRTTPTSWPISAPRMPIPTR